jgi:hypothetical protein
LRSVNSSGRSRTLRARDMMNTQKTKQLIPINLKLFSARTKQNGEKNYVKRTRRHLNYFHRHFRLQPNSKERCGIYIVKDATDSEDFIVKLDVAIKKSDKKIMQIDLLEWESHEFKFGIGRGCPKFLKNETIFDLENKYILDNTLTLIIHVRTSLKPSLCSLFNHTFF